MVKNLKPETKASKKAAMMLHDMKVSIFTRSQEWVKTFRNVVMCYTLCYIGIWKKNAADPDLILMQPWHAYCLYGICYTLLYGVGKKSVRPCITVACTYCFLYGSRTPRLLVELRPSGPRWEAIRGLMHMHLWLALAYTVSATFC